MQPSGSDCIKMVSHGTDNASMFINLLLLFIYYLLIINLTFTLLRSIMSLFYVYHFLDGAL